MEAAPHIPDHKLLRHIGKGAYGEVWLAVCVTGAYRAVKIVYRSSFDHARPYEREFSGIQKYEPVSRTHETQVSILHVGRNDAEGYFYYIMEVADDRLTGQNIRPDSYEPWTLRNYLQQREQVPVGECLDIGLHLAGALEHIHKNGLVHRDVKPSNIIFVNAVPKLADIGLVTGADATRSFVGTEGYIPPEGPGSPQADIYSLGKVLYEVSTGRNRLDFPELPAFLKDLPEREALVQFNEVVLKACEEDPKHRYQTAAEMLKDLWILKSGNYLRPVRPRTGLRKLWIALLAVGIAVVFYCGLKLFPNGGLPWQRHNPMAGDMALIPAGPFTMGDTLDGERDAIPPVSVKLSAFYMDKNFVSYTQWQSVIAWAWNHGFDFDHPGSGKAANHPAQTIDWYDGVKWCNARSQQAGLTPVYYTDAGLTQVYANGDTDTVYPDWAANGYRLPTEAEWEKAARGGLSGKRFPWGDTISENQANYKGDTARFSYDLGSDGYNEAFTNTEIPNPDPFTGVPYTSPAGHFAPNGYGLYDMAGNVMAWCWDWYGTPYGQPTATNPTGPTTGDRRVLRGGRWGYLANDSRCANRSDRRLFVKPSDAYNDIGLRCVRVAVQTVQTGDRKPELSGQYEGDLPTNPVQSAQEIHTDSLGHGVEIKSITPTGMELIPTGIFTMGDSSDENPNSLPRRVNVSAFFMEKNLVSFSLWLSVRDWAQAQGYNFAHPGSGKAANHPVQTVDWFDCVKWCNARSRQAGLKPVYYTDPGMTQVYVTGELSPYPDWNANGYRLPTEAEWEKASRGGLEGERFPWGDTISWKYANCCGIKPSQPDPHYEGPAGWNPAFRQGGAPYTSPIGNFPPNGYGLYDMSGNLLEWCWDWAGAYGDGDNPRGPSFGSDRIMRGGSWKNTFAERCAWRAPNKPIIAQNTIGFRCVRNFSQNTVE